MTRRYIGSLPFAAPDERTAISDDPRRATVRIDCEGDTLRVRLDEEPSVVEATR